MARARNIKPAFFTNELLGVADPMVCLTFAGLWCLADKVGVLEDRPLRIKAELFPYRESLDVNGYLTELARMGFIVRYENSGKRFIQVCNFRKHQSPHHTEKGKGYPFSTDPKSLILDGNGYVTVNEPRYDGESQVPERSDSLIPDTGFTDSLIPDLPQHDRATDEPDKPARAPKKTRIPDPFMLTVEMRQWAAESAPAVDVKAETENFVDYWRGEAKTKADWPATWRNWMRRAQKDSAGKRGSFGTPINRQQQVEQENARVVQEIIARESGLDLGVQIAIEGEVIHVE